MARILPDVVVVNGLDAIFCVKLCTSSEHDSRYGMHVSTGCGDLGAAPFPLILRYRRMRPGRWPQPWQNGTVRIAIDTNILIAALTRPGGRSARIVEAWLDGEIEVVASEATVREAELVMGGGWLRRVAARERVTALLEALRTRTVWVDSPDPITGLRMKDEGD